MNVEKVESSTQLDRQQLLELFTGSSSTSSSSSSTNETRDLIMNNSSSSSSRECNTSVLLNQPRESIYSIGRTGSSGCKQLDDIVSPLPPATEVGVIQENKTDSSRVSSSWWQGSRWFGMGRSRTKGHSSGPSTVTTTNSSSRGGSGNNGMIAFEAGKCGNGTGLVAAGEAVVVEVDPDDGEQQQLLELPRSRSGSVTAVAAHGEASGVVLCAPDPLAFLSELPLYGSQDHAGMVEHLSRLEWFTLGFRGMYLILVFLPFFCCGLSMLSAATAMLHRAEAMQELQEVRQQRQRERDSGRGLEAALVHRNRRLQLLAVAELSKRQRQQQQQQWQWWPQQLSWQQLKAIWAVAVAWLGTCLDLLLLLCVGGHWHLGVSVWESAGLHLRRSAWQLLLWGCRMSGTAFIKWGQWSSARRDLFPEDFCEILGSLHDQAPRHGFRQSKRLVEAAFGRPLRDLFVEFDERPVASGSIAQVHRAVQQLPDGSQRVVAVKVRHPRVASNIRMDFKLLGMVSAAVGRVPALKGLSLRESVSQFSHTMTAQTDLRVEAVHALRFFNNFSGEGSRDGGRCSSCHGFRVQGLL